DLPGRKRPREQEPGVVGKEKRAQDKADGEEEDQRRRGGVGQGQHHLGLPQLRDGLKQRPGECGHYPDDDRRHQEHAELRRGQLAELLPAANPGPHRREAELDVEKRPEQGEPGSPHAAHRSAASGAGSSVSSRKMLSKVASSRPADRSSSRVPTAMRRPLLMMPTRSQSRSATSRMWVEKKTV